MIGSVLPTGVRWLAFGCLLSLTAHAAPTVVDVRDTGAVPDGKTLCTAAIQQAIDRCAAAGGGTVCFPAGKYVSGGLVLKSYITLQLEAGATLIGSREPKDYPHHNPATRSYTDNYVRQALIYGENLEFVTLRGEGTIDGSGDAFHWKEYRDRPYVIRLVGCRDVVVEGVSLRRSPMWMQHYLACDRLQVRGVKVFNHGGYNNDGIDIDSCHDVTISDCVIDSDDDALCLKSTLDRACENVTVTNCVLSTHCNAFKLGTESNGGFRNIAFSNSVILSPRFSQKIHGAQRGMSGVALESVDGGRLENIVVNNISISGINVPIFLRLGNRARPFTADGPTPGMGSFRNVMITDVIATGMGRIGCSITGLPGHYVENVTLANLSFEFEGGGEQQLAGKAVLERADAYPESRMFGDLPAYGLYCRHVRGIRMSGVRLTTLAPDARHAIVCDDVQDLDMVDLKTPAVAGGAAIVRLTDVVDARIRGWRTTGAAEVFIKLEGAATSEVLLQGNDLSRVKQPVQPASDVRKGAWREGGGI